MEKNLESYLEEIENVNNVTGYVVTDQQGLCLAASPHIKPELSGIISAITKQAEKIEIGGDQPVILLENDTRQCLIHQNDGVTTAIFKKIQQAV